MGPLIIGYNAVQLSPRAFSIVMVATLLLVGFTSLVTGVKALRRRWNFGEEREVFEKVWTEQIAPNLDSADAEVLRRAILKGEKLVDKVLQNRGFKNKSFSARLEAATRTYHGGMVRAEFFQTVAVHIHNKKVLPVKRLQGALKDCRLMLHTLGLRV